MPMGALSGRPSEGHVRDEIGVRLREFIVVA
jgi:hypothetical protein